MQLPTPVRWSSLSDPEQTTLLQRPGHDAGTERQGAVAEIIAEVRARGDHAVAGFTQRFDGVTTGALRISAEVLEEAATCLSVDTRRALERAIANVGAFHQAQRPPSIDMETTPGIRCQRQWRPIQRVGLYVPGGTAPLCSTVIMLAVPATLAGCPRRILCTPPRPDGSVDPTVLATAAMCGIEEVFAVGGAQAIAAMALGTETIPQVDKIFGPGNAYVTEAKTQVAQLPQGPTIDLPAGPSEVLIIADDRARPEVVAADLLSQAEHGADSQVILVSPETELIEATRRAIKTQLQDLARNDLAAAALTHARFIVADDLDEAFTISNRYAPEHLSLQIADGAQRCEAVTAAGSVFIGPWSPVAAGDYASGTNHVLPTSGYARGLSGLGLEDFMTRITFQELSRKGLIDLEPILTALAGVEGLDAHAKSVTIRLATGEETP